MNPLVVHVVARFGNLVGMGNWKRSSLLAHKLADRGHSVLLETVSDRTISNSALPNAFRSGSPSSTQIDVQIVDDPMEPTELCARARKRVGMDFYGAPDGFFDLVINAIDRTPPEVVRTSTAKRLSGFQFLAMEEAATSYEPLTPNLEKKKRALFVLGGRDTRRATLPLLQLILNNEFSKRLSKAQVVLPAEHPDFNEIKTTLASFPCPTRLLPVQDSLIPLFRQSSLIFCNGGMTATLALLQKRPAVFFPQSAEEAEFLTLLGVPASQMVLMEVGNHWPTIEKALFVASEASTFPDVARLGFDGKASQRIAQAVEELAA